MRLRMYSRHLRVACGMVLVASLVGFLSVNAVGSGQSQARRSIDPPTASRGKLGTELFFSLDHRNLNELNQLLKKGADANATNGLQLTPLHIAAASHQPDAMKSLIQSGAKPDADTIYGTPLMFAASSAHVNGMNMLIERKADVNASRPDGQTPLLMAATTGAPPAIELLIKKGAKVNAANMQGTTALSISARLGHEPTAGMLIGAGARVNQADVHGITPLMEAARSGHLNLVQMLLSKGANPNARDKQGRTALMLAKGYTDNAEIARALEAAGAKATVKDASGKTAADYARARSSVSRVPRDAAIKALRRLEASMEQFGRGTSCVSCHHEGLGRMVTASAANYGVSTNKVVQQMMQARVGGMVTGMRPLHEAALKSPEAMKQIPLIEMNEVNPIDAWVLAGKAWGNEPATASTAAMALVLARQQMPDGSWSFSLPRAPMQSSFFTLTALAVRSLRAYGPRANAEEIAERIGRAKGWLLNAKPQTTEDRASRLLGLRWAGATDEECAEAVKAVLADQRADGGWAISANGPSDAYATGLALVALSEGAKLATSDAVYQRGVKFLVRTQDAEGTWFIPKQTTPANNYYDSGFPHGESQYSSFAGTSWATMALMRTLPTKSANIARR